MKKIFLACCTVFLWGTGAVFGKEKPNVLLIIVDDLRTELGCYGTSYVKSPHMDKLAESSMVFDRAYCSSPICGPSRVAMLTSTRLYEPAHVASASVSAEKLFPQARSIAAYFKDAGYTTITAGKVFHQSNDNEKDWTRQLGDLRTYKNTPEHQNYEKNRAAGKDKLLPELNMLPIDPASFALINERTGRGPVVESPDVPDNAYTDGKLAETAMKQLKTLKEEGKPFFFACGFTRPHLPFYAPRKYWDLYDRAKIPLAKNKERPDKAPSELKSSTEFTQYHLLGMTPGSEEFSKVMKHGYLASVSYVDAQIGLLLETLEKLKLDKETIVVLWGDHGWNLGEHSFWGKHTLVDNATRLPLMIKVPGLPVGRHKSVIESVDIMPTLCELASIKIPETAAVSGTSLVPLLKSPSSTRTQPALSIFGKGKTVITERFAYTEYGKGGSGHRMLYDHLSDPEENKNVSEDPAYATHVEELSKLLHSELAKAAESR